jgi:acetyl-CoA synthetase
VVTCSGGDAAISADEAERLDIPMPSLTMETEKALGPVMPDAATIGNPLDYTAMIWGETQQIADIVSIAGADPSLAQVLVYYDRPQKMDEHSTASWDATLDGILLGAKQSPAPVLVASTLPDLLPEETVQRCLDAGVPAVWGLTTGLKVANALRTPGGDPKRLRAIAALATDSVPGEWLSEHQAKELLRSAGVSVPLGEVVDSADAAVAFAQQQETPVVMKLSSPDLQHKSDIGALELGLSTPEEIHAAFSRLRGIPGHHATPVLIEPMAAPGVEMLVSARRDAVVPVLVVGLGGIWVEALGDAAIIPLPADVARIEAGLRSLRGAALLTGGRGEQGVGLTALAQLAARVGEALIAQDLELIELNPVFARHDGATAVDAVARRSGPPAKP